MQGRYLASNDREWMTLSNILPGSQVRVRPTVRVVVVTFDRQARYHVIPGWLRAHTSFAFTLNQAASSEQVEASCFVLTPTPSPAPCDHSGCRKHLNVPAQGPGANTGPPVALPAIDGCSSRCLRVCAIWVHTAEGHPGVTCWQMQQTNKTLLEPVTAFHGG